jgi:hypothetical protein
VLKAMRFLAVLAVAAALAGCNRVPPLAGTYDTPEALARAVLSALAAADRPRLEALALSEAEFRAHVWPSLPAAREERNLPFSYVWGDLRQKSGHSLSGIVAAQGGLKYELAGVRFEGETDYGQYTVHREASFDVRLSSGRTETVRVCGSMIEKDGGWKVFSYVVDD